MAMQDGVKTNKLVRRSLDEVDKTVSVLQILDSSFNDADFAQLVKHMSEKQIKDIREINLTGTDITDRSQAVLALFINADMINLTNTKITEKTLAGCLENKSLLTLLVSFTDIKSIPIVAGSNVTEVNLSGCQQLDLATLPNLAALRLLKVLDISQIQLTFDILKRLVCLKNLVVLEADMEYFTQCEEILEDLNESRKVIKQSDNLMAKFEEKPSKRDTKDEKNVLTKPEVQSELHNAHEGKTRNFT